MNQGAESKRTQMSEDQITLPSEKAGSAFEVLSNKDLLKVGSPLEPGSYNGESEVEEFVSGSSSDIFSGLHSHF